MSTLNLSNETKQKISGYTTLTKEKLDLLNQRIKDAEKTLQDGMFMHDAYVDNLKWSFSDQRIMCNEGGVSKPLIEHKLDVRLAMNDRLELLVEEALQQNTCS